MPPDDMEMTPEKAAVLEFLAQSDLALPPDTIEKNLEAQIDNRFEQEPIQAAIKTLHDQNLITEHHEVSNHYVLTAAGAQFFSEDAVILSTRQFGR